MEEGKMYRKNDNIDKHGVITELISRCCHSSHYTFDILKCGKETCRMCKPVQVPPHIFRNLHHIPHPTLGEDNHYKPFSEVFGSLTTEQYPSLGQMCKGKNSLPF